MTDYDPDFIKEYANLLYKKANFAVRLLSILGMALGFIIFLILYFVDSGSANDWSNKSTIFILSMMVTLIVVGFGAGNAVGKQLALRYKIKAQISLCQVQIEKHLRIQKQSNDAN